MIYQKQVEVLETVKIIKRDRCGKEEPAGLEYKSWGFIAPRINVSGSKSYGLDLCERCLSSVEVDIRSHNEPKP